MRECHGCGTDIDTNDGVTAVPARAGESIDKGEWWHPECRQAELRKRVGKAGATPAAKRPRAGHAVTATVDDDPEV